HGCERGCLTRGGQRVDHHGGGVADHHAGVDVEYGVAQHVHPVGDLAPGAGAAISAHHTSDPWPPHWLCAIPSGGQPHSAITVPSPVPSQCLGGSVEEAVPVHHGAFHPAFGHDSGALSED